MSRHLPRVDDGHAPPEVRHVDWTDAQGTIELDVGRWTMYATANTLTLRVEAAGEEDLRLIQSLVGNRVEQIGRRDRLTVVWERVDSPAPAPLDGGSPRPAKRRSLLATRALIAFVIVVVVGVHLGLGGAALASWSVWTAAGVGVVLLLKVFAVRLLAKRRHALGGVARHLISRIGHRSVRHDGRGSSNPGAS
jgi:hypothetical protein